MIKHYRSNQRLRNDNKIISITVKISYTIKTTKTDFFFRIRCYLLSLARSFEDDVTRKVCDGAAGKFVRPTKVDERNEGEERLIETSANRSYVPAICYGIHYIYTSYYQPLCSTCCILRFDRRVAFAQISDETLQKPRLDCYIYKANPSWSETYVSLDIY